MILSLKEAHIHLVLDLLSSCDVLLIQKLLVTLVVVELRVDLQTFFLVLLELYYLGILVRKHPMTPFVLLLWLLEHLHVGIHHIVASIYVHWGAVVHNLLVMRVRRVHWYVILVPVIMVVWRLGLKLTGVIVHKMVCRVPPPLAAPKLLMVAGGALAGHRGLLIELSLLKFLQIQLH